MPSAEAAMPSRLGLGTVQFGIDYGISNPDGRTPPDEAARILALAAAKGISLLDTAPGYGESERVLGAFPLRDRGFKVVTKTPAFGDGTKEGALTDSLKVSLARLGIGAAYGLLFHRASDLMGAQGEALMEEARRCRAEGWVSRIGVTVYTAEEIEEVMGRHHPDLVQVPVNVFDQRLVRSGHLKAMKAAGVEVHARSAFLQGMLLMEPGNLPPGLERARAPLEAFREFALDRGLTSLEAALGFVLGLREVDTVICGVNTCRHLEEVCSAAVPRGAEAYVGLAVDDVSILNPSAWGELK